MAESSIFWVTNGTGDGATNYTASDMQAFFKRLFLRDSTAEGVMQGYNNELSVSGTVSPVTVATGAALVYGIPYENTTATTVAIPTPTTATRTDYIALRADYSAQTVRIVRVPGTEGAGDPSLTQSAGVTWEIPLARVTITTGGGLIVFDARNFIRGSFSIIHKRDGSSSTDWVTPSAIGTPATVNTSNATMLVGSISNLGTGTSGTATITMPGTFAYIPIVFVTMSKTAPVNTAVNIHVPHTSVTTTTFDVEWNVIDGVTSLSNLIVYYLAIGPMS